ncbi:MAG: MCE family protein [Deltaproteobacteria bacterium]|nr:MCE family protein [Deltaproteobacteria bacterium]
MADRGYSMEVKVGALILISLVLLVGFIVVLGDFRCSEQSVLYVDFPTSADLKAGAPVKITGVTVGKVTVVDLWGGVRDPEHDNKIVQVRVTLSVDEKVPGLLHRDARYYITTLGALGEKYVEIDPGSPDEPTLKSGDVVDGKGPLRLEHLGADASSILDELDGILKENRANVKELVKNIRDISDQANEMIAENRESVKVAIDKVRESMEHVTNLTETLDLAAGDGKDLKQIIASLKNITSKLDREVTPAFKRIPGIAEKVEKTVEELFSLLSEGRATIADGRVPFQDAMENVRAVIRDLKEGKGSIGALLSDRELYDDLVEIIKDIKRHPWKVLWKE